MDKWRPYKENREPKSSLWKSQQTHDSLKQFENHEKILPKTPIYIISPTFFHLDRAENDDGDRSSEEIQKPVELLS